MKITTAVVLVAAASANASKLELTKKTPYTYEDFQRDFPDVRDFAAGDLTEHKQIFDKNVAMIQEHNEGAHSWKMGVNKFADMTDDEKSAYFMGYNKQALPGTSGTSASKSAKVTDLPAEVDWRTEGVVTPVKNQGSCGSCWAFSGTESIESAVAIATGELLELSPQLYVSCSPNPDDCGGTGGCDGSTMELLFEYAMTAGAVLEANYPYEAVTGTCNDADTLHPVANISGYVQNGVNSYDDLMSSVANIGPVSVTVAATPWEFYSSGIFSPPSGLSATWELNHGVQMVGYGTDGSDGYYLVRNSWGTSWGEAGYIRLARTDDEASNCGTDSAPQDGVACKGEDEPMTVCGTSGILYDTSYPTGATLV